jgi:SAM-dependent methyltransferase
MYVGTAPLTSSGEAGLRLAFVAIEHLDEHRAENFRNWESRVPVHAASLDYNLAGLAADPAKLSPVVSYDRPWLGDLTGLDAVHVQCHIGTDTVSLARLGARVTGVDFSPGALAVARELARDCGIDARFVESELYAIPKVLGAEFDLVYTGVGALNWLPDIAGWARVVAGLLRPGGRLYLRDAHPMLLTMDYERTDDLLSVVEPYFEAEAQYGHHERTYTDGPTVACPGQYQWNHGLGETVQAVIGAGLSVTALREHKECEWQALSQLVEGDDGKFRLAEGADRLPLMFTLEAHLPLPRSDLPPRPAV